MLLSPRPTAAILALPVSECWTVFEYSKNYMESPGLIPEAHWRHSSGSCKAGTSTVTLVWLCIGAPPARRPDFQQLPFPLEQVTSPRATGDLGNDKWQNQHLIFTETAEPFFGPNPDNLSWKASGTAVGTGDWREEMKNHKTTLSGPI